MALDSVKNAANYLTYGNGAFNPKLSGASKIVISAIIWPDSFSTTNNVSNSILRVMIDGTSTGVAFNIDAFTGGASNGRVRIAGRSVTGETQETRSGSGDVGTGAWKHVGAIMDIGNDLLYTVLNGVVEGSTAVTFNNATYTAGTPTVPDRVGANDDTPPATSDQFDGRIGPLTIWVLGSGDPVFTAEEWAALGAFWHPSFIRGGQRVFHEQFLDRLASPRDDISNLTGTITGTLNYAEHPPVLFPISGYLFPPSASILSLVGTPTAQAATISGAAAEVTSHISGTPTASQAASLTSAELEAIASAVAELEAQAATVSGAAAEVTTHLTGSPTAQAANTTSGSGTTGEVSQPVSTQRLRQWWLGLKLRQGGGSTGSLAFIDEFVGAENMCLEDRVGWTRVDGTACGVQVNAASQVKNTTTTDTAYQAMGAGSANHYAQVVAGSQFHSGGFKPFGPCVRVLNKDNFIGLRTATGPLIQLYKRVSGTFTELFSVSGTISAGDIVRVQVIGTTVKVFVNAIQVGTDQTVSDAVLMTVETPGLVARTQAVTSWFDNWESGPSI